MNLHVVTPLFTGPTTDEALIAKRLGAWNDWLQSDGYDELKTACEKRASICPYFPGAEIVVPHKRDPNAIRVVFPANREARVPKGLVARFHLLVLLERTDRDGTDPAEVVFACIDGSGAFEFDSLKLLVESLKENPDVDVVLGRRPSDYSGMASGRKEVEEFEQFLLFRHRLPAIERTFPGHDLRQSLLPDGQAGCWAFRLSVASRLPLTASGYEIEFDLLASSLEAGLRVVYTEPLLMPRQERHSSASAAAIEMSLRKLSFIERKLRIGRDDIAEAWEDFVSRFAASDIIKNMLPGYREALMEYCSRGPQA